MNLSAGQFITFKNSLYCIVSVNLSDTLYYVIAADAKRWPKRVYAGSLANEGKVAEAKPQQWPQPGSSAQKEMERRWQAIKPCIDNPEIIAEILSGSGRKILLRTYAEQAGISLRSFSTYLKQYWAGGSTPLALHPNFEQRGGKSTPRFNIVTGRLPRHGTRAPPMTQKLAGIIDEGLRWGAAGNIKSLREIHLHIITKFFSIIGAEGHVVALADGAPTFAQVRKVKERNYTKDTWRRMRMGERAYVLKGRPLYGRADQHVIGPGDQFQIDATIADIYLVSVIDKATIVGRPTIYFIVDLFSRMIVSIYITFDPPSWAAAMIAVVNMVTPKVDYCARYGVTISDQEWPCAHAPISILGDKGEMEKLSAGSALVRNLNINLQNAASRRADMKAVCERKFGTIQSHFRPYIAGAVQKDAEERGAPDYKQGAKHTLAEFTKIVIHAVLEYNNHRIIEKYTPPESFTLHGLAASPLNLWNWGIQHAGLLRRMDPATVALAVLPEGLGTLDRHGLSFNGYRYIFPTADQLGWAADARAEGSQKIPLRYDPRDLSRLIVVDPRLASPEVAELRPHERIAVTGISYAEVSLVREMKRANDASFRSEHRLELVKARYDRDRLSRDDSRSGKHSSAKSRHARNVERRVLHDSYQLPTAPPVPATPQPASSCDDDLRELEVLREFKRNRTRE